MKIFLSIKNRSFEFLHDVFLLPKICLFNFRALPLCQAIRLPLYVNYGVKIKEIHHGNIIIQNDDIRKYMISFGRGGSEGIAITSAGLISLKRTSRIIFKGTAHFHAGSRLCLDEKANVVIGDGFSANRNFTLYYNNEAFFGNDCMLGWNIEIIDGNGHIVLENNIKHTQKCKICLGNHVWVGANVKICRSVEIGDNCIVAYGSTIVGGKFQMGTMIGGYPAKMIKSNVNWVK